MSRLIDLGGGHSCVFFGGIGEPVGEAEVEPQGLIHNHPRPDGQGMCAGVACFRGKGDGNRPEWDVLSTDPLTLSPSLLCRTCGCHGWIRDGKWVSD